MVVKRFAGPRLPALTAVRKETNPSKALSKVPTGFARKDMTAFPSLLLGNIVAAFISHHIVKL